ncbi:zinc finger B-box domain-containing protein 1 isoform X2 [Silurus meridionalis]|uniref:zinc finger B-box domain-containing protein 1 isoform X2 n=1 Tax=Silurus meridionalis TaxID=175797 RepID=UPI001EEABFB0|nr:zinc finger B-box domain-containing protein 1 isoform X2 [Silurus meridionalis]
MNSNNFVVLPNKSKSVKLKVRNLRELRMETAQLSQDNKGMENRLQQLREVMSREKVERERYGAFRWKSAQTQDGTKEIEKKLNKSSSGKIKIKVLKDETVPAEKMPKPPPPKDGQSKKSRLKRKVCGQCETRTAGLVCAECAEDYCVGCFAKFHQKGALRLHHIIPMQAELQTSISTLDVFNRFQKKTQSEEEYHNGDERPDSKHSATSSSLHPVSVNQIHSTQELFVDNADKENEDSLLRGSFDEEESSRSFQQALNEWRAGNTHSNREHQEQNHSVQTSRSVSVDVKEAQAGGQSHIRIEFMDHGLSYMEKLLLKKHRRTQIESYQLLSNQRSLQDVTTKTQTQPAEETQDTQELTAEEMDLHHYCASLFAVSSSAEAGKTNNIFKSYLSITEIDETAGDPLVDASFGVKQGDDKKVKQSGDEVQLHPTKPLDFLHKSQTLANETILSGSLELLSQSPPSEQILFSPTLTGSELLSEEQNKEHELQGVQPPKYLKPQISKYPPKTKSTLKYKTEVWDSCSFTSISSQSHNSPLINMSIQSQSLEFDVPSNPKQSNQTRSNTPNPTLPSHSVEEVKCQTKPHNSSPSFFESANNTTLGQLIQSPPSDKLSSFTSNKSEKANISASIYSPLPVLITAHQQGELQKATSPRHNDFPKSQIPKRPSAPQSKAVVDWESSLSMQSHSPLLSSSEAFSTSVMPKLSTISPEDQCATVYAEVPTSSLSKPVQVEEDEKMLTQSLHSPRHVDFHKPQTPRSPLKATSTQSIDSTFSPQSHSPLPLTSIECLSPAFSISSRTKLSPTPTELYHIKAKALTPLSTKSFSQTESGNTPSQSQPPSEFQKSPLSAGQSSSDDEEPYFLPLGSSSFLAKSEVLRSSPPLHLNSSSSDMSSDSFGIMLTDGDSSGDEMRRMQDMKEEEERNTFSYPPSLFPNSDVLFPSQSFTTKEQSGIFTKPSLAVSSLAQTHNSVSTNYQGLDGFFTLGLESRSVPLTPAVEHTAPEMHTHSTNSETFMSGSSAQVTQHASHPVSRAALENLNIQSVDQAEVTQFKQDEDDLLTIAALEEEFKCMSAEPNMFGSEGDEDNRFLN